MNELVMSIGAFIMGIFAGSLSGMTLIRQTTFLRAEGARYVVLFPLVRVISLAILVFYLLHWGTIPFILFGVSMTITMWIVILTFN
jgi:hypothetical protein